MTCTGFARFVPALLLFGSLAATYPARAQTEDWDDLARPGVSVITPNPKTSGSTTTFVERGIGDVLISWENEAVLAVKELGQGKFDIVAPSVSILAEPPISLVDKVVDKKGTRKVAQAYLEYWYTPEAQEIAAKNFYRPIDAKVLAKYESQFPKVQLFTIGELFGSWQKAQKEHFADGAVFDQIYLK